MKSILTLIKERNPGFEKQAIGKLMGELEFIRRNKDLLSHLQKFEGTYEKTLNLKTVIKENLRLDTVSTISLDVNNAFAFKTAACQYDTFNYDLAKQDEANWLESIRQHYKQGDEYGPSQTWIVYYYEPCYQTGTLVRMKYTGKLSALQLNFPDHLTRLIMELAGVDLTTIKRPIMIVRAAHIEKA